MMQHDIPTASHLQSRTDEAEVWTVPANTWRDAVAHVLRRGYTFCGLHATQVVDKLELRAAFSRSSNFQMLICEPNPESETPTIVDLVPAAAWDEREAADTAGLVFEGHQTRPLVAHVDSLEMWTTPVHGRDTHQVAVGPIHAGIIESGHFRFHVVGERILQLDLRLFYKHRGLERAAHGQPLNTAVAFAQRACAGCAVTNSVAYAGACEQALGLVPSADIARVRTVLLELERLYNHLNDISAACAGIGFAAGNMIFSALKEQAQRINSDLTGHRFLYHTISVGGSQLEITSRAADAARQQLAEIQKGAARAWHEILFQGSVQNRFDGVGRVTLNEATSLGTVGPSARASGVTHDTRCESPRLAYQDFVAAVPSDPSGDVRARIEMRALELPATFGLIDSLLSGGIPTSQCEKQGEPTATGMAAVESPRGRTFCTIERNDAALTRLRLRTSSYANWPTVALAANGEFLPEFPLINKSFELCYACVDR
jgi:Ni,Fe-hydrogenase III large subunit